MTIVVFGMPFHAVMQLWRFGTPYVSSPQVKVALLDSVSLNAAEDKGPPTLNGDAAAGSVEIWSGDMFDDESERFVINGKSVFGRGLRAKEQTLQLWKKATSQPPRYIVRVTQCL